MIEEMTLDKVKEDYMGGIDCAQVVFRYGAEILGLDPETAVKIAAAFGGGMFHGETCGCVTGALMAIGYRYGHYKPGDEDAKNLMREKKAEFEEAFTAMHGSLLCREILKYDITKPEELQKVMEEGLMMTLCPQLACDACDLLDEIL